MMMLNFNKIKAMHSSFEPSTNHNGDSEGVFEQSKSCVRSYVASATRHQHMRYSEFMDGELHTSHIFVKI